MKNKITIIWIWHDILDDRIYYKQAISLSKKYNITLIWWQWKNEKIWTDENNIHLIEIKGNPIKRIIKSIILGIKNKSDIYVAHDLFSYFSIVIIKLFKWKSKIVFDVHEFYSRYPIKSLNFKWKLTFIIFLYIIKPLTSRLFTGFTGATPEMLDYYPSTKEKEVIYNFPPKYLFDNIQSNNKLNSNYTYLVYHGWISEDRWIWNMLKLLKEYTKINPNVKLLLIWWFSSKELEKHIFKYIKNNKLQNKVIYTGKLPFKDTIAYLKNPVKKIWLWLCNKVWQRWKTLPIKLVEYLYLEIPVLSSSHDKYFNEIIALNNCWIWVNEKDINHQIKHLKELESNYDKYRNNCKKVKDNYIWKNEEKKLLNFYDKILWT